MRGFRPHYQGKVTNPFVNKWKKLSNKERAELAFSMDKELKDIHKDLRLMILKRGELACIIAESGAYKILMGDDNATLQAYLAQPEFKIHYRQFFRVMRAWQVWVNEFGYKPEDLYEIPVELLEKVGQIVTEENKEEWFHALKSLSTEDIKIYINEQKGIKQDDCPHDQVNTFKKCTRCREIIHDKRPEKR